MKKIIMTFLLIISQPIFSADHDQSIQVKLNSKYGLGAQYPVVVDKNRFIFSRYDKTGITKEIISLDPLFSTEKLLAVGNRHIRYLADNDTYVAYYERGEGMPGRVKLSRKSDDQVFQSVRLSHGALDAYFANDQLVVRQRTPYTKTYSVPVSHWSVFAVPTLKFIREFDAPEAQKIVRLDRNTIFLARKHIGLYDENFNEKYSASNHPYELADKVNWNWNWNLKSPGSLVVTNRMEIFVANYGEIYSFSLTSGELKSRLRLDQMSYNLASDGKYLFAVPTEPVNSPGYTGGIVISLSSWKVIGKFEALGIASYADGENLMVLSLPKWNEGMVSIYGYAPSK